MARSTYTTEWGADRITISADFAEASCPVDGVEGGMQVADFRHRPALAMRAAVEQAAGYEGGADREAIDAAVADMVEVTPEYVVEQDEDGRDDGTVAGYGATYPEEDGEGACDVTVYLRRHEYEGVEAWTVHTTDDAGGGDQGDGVAYATRDEAEAAAEALAEERDELGGQSAEDWLAEKDESAAEEAEEDDAGEWAVYYDTALEGESHVVSRHPTREDAEAVCRVKQAEFERANPASGGTTLLCGYDVRRLVGGRWQLVAAD